MTRNEGKMGVDPGNATKGDMRGDERTGWR